MRTVVPTAIIAVVKLVAALVLAWWASTRQTRRGWFVTGAGTRLALVITGWLGWRVVVGA